MLVGLLAARNAGIEIPDQAIDKAIAYYKSMTAPSGQVAYTSGMGGFDESIARISIASLVYAVARRKDLAEYKATVDYLKQRLEQQVTQQWLEYARYYQAQALFQGDIDAWEKLEQAPGPAAQGRAEAGRQLPGPVRSHAHDIVFAACPGPQLSLFAHLRTVEHALSFDT